MDLENVVRDEFLDHNDVPKRSTISNFLAQNKLNIIKLLKRPLVSERNKVKRIDFANFWLDDPDSLVDSVIWSDETMVRMAPQNKQITFRCHASKDKEKLPFNYQIQNGGFSVMFWGCISAYGIGPLVALEGSQNQESYLNLLREYPIPEIEAAKRMHGVNFTFMHDNAPCHKATAVTNFLEQNQIPTLEWPAQSPDLNPIENVWSFIKRRRQKRFGMPTNRQDLIDQVFQIWDELTVADVENTIDSMENRLNEVVKMGGRSTRY